MTFSPPSLNTYSASDLDYINKMNADNTALNTSFNDLIGDVTAVHNASGAGLIAEWERKGPSSESWPAGVLGAYSLVLDTTDIANDNISLVTTNSSTSASVIIGGVRRTISSTLTIDLKTMGISSDGNTIAYIGVNTSGDTSMVIAGSTTQSALALALYGIPITVSGTQTAFALNGTPYRIPKTVFWDNTVEQLRQETPQLVSFYVGSPATTAHPRVKVPYDHYIDGVNVLCGNVTNGGMTVAMLEGATTVMTVDGTTTDFDLSFESGFSSAIAYAANREYKVDFTSLGGGLGSISDATITLQLRRAYNAPLYS